MCSNLTTFFESPFHQLAFHKCYFYQFGDSRVMKKRFSTFLIISLVLCCCQPNQPESSSIIDSVENNKRDSLFMQQSNAVIYYDKTPLFDTTFMVFYGSMCYQGSQKNPRYRISNSNYNCTDTFGFILNDIPVDTFLNMDFSINKVYYSNPDSSYFNKAINLAETIRRA